MEDVSKKTYYDYKKLVKFKKENKGITIKQTNSIYDENISVNPFEFFSRNITTVCPICQEKHLLLEMQVEHPKRRVDNGTTTVLVCANCHCNKTRMENTNTKTRQEENFNIYISNFQKKEFESINSRTDYDKWFHRYSSLLVCSSPILKERPKFFIRLCLETLIDLGIDLENLTKIMNLTMRKKFSLTNNIKEEIINYYNNSNANAA